MFYYKLCQTSPSRCLVSSTHIFDTATDTNTPQCHSLLMLRMCGLCATDGRMLHPLPRYCLLHIVDPFANEDLFICDQVIIWVCFQRFASLLAKQHAVSKLKLLRFLFHQTMYMHWLCDVKNKKLFDCLLSPQHVCQNLSKFVHVHQSYSNTK